MKLAGLKSIENAHKSSIWSLCWFPATSDRQSLLLTGSLDETVRLWVLDKISLAVSSFGGHSLDVISVAAHPARAIAASISLDSFVRVFDVESNSTIAMLEAPASEIWSLQFDPRPLALNIKGDHCRKFCNHLERSWQNLYVTMRSPFLIPNIISIVKLLSPKPEKTFELLQELKNTSKMLQFWENYPPSKPLQNAEKTLSKLPLYQEKAPLNSQDLKNMISNLLQERGLLAN